MQNPSQLNPPNVTTVSPDDYKKYYPVYLFEIEQLKQLTDDDPTTIENTYLNGYYRDLLLKKLYFDEQCFKGDRPPESRRIDTLAELKKLERKEPQSQSAKISIFEAIRAWLNTINDFRLGNMLWPRIGLESVGTFTLISKTDGPNAYFGVYAYLLNVFITILQSIRHACISLEKVNELKINNYLFKSEEKIKTSGLRFLAMHKYKFTNDFMWAPINAFYFINQAFKTFRSLPIIGDTLCVALFIIDVLIGMYQQRETEQKFINLQLNFIENIVKIGGFGKPRETDLDAPEVNSVSVDLDSIEEESLEDILRKKGFAEDVVKKLLEQMEIYSIENFSKLKDYPMYKALESLQNQKKKAHWEHQKNIYLSTLIACAMSSFILSDILNHSDINFLLIGSIFAIVAKLTLITYNFYEKTKGLDNGDLLSFHRKQFLCQIMQQLIFLGLSLSISLFVVPLLNNKTPWVIWCLVAICIGIAFAIVQLLQQSIDSPPPIISQRPSESDSDNNSDDKQPLLQENPLSDSESDSDNKQPLPQTGKGTSI